MTEEYLHYIWKYRLYKPGLRLSSGEPLEVLHPGDHNTDSGPDFFNARIQWGSTLWAGNVEIHILSSDWLRHHHQTDRTYETVILHVVYRNDKVISYPGGQLIPTLELKEFMDQESWQRYLRFMSSKSWIPCEKLLQTIDQVQVVSWLDRLLVERLERKSRIAEKVMLSCYNDWNAVFFRLLATNFGFNLNNLAFEKLASSIAYATILRHSGQLFQLEALLFGQAGFIQQDYRDEYPQSLKKEYEFLQRKYSLTPMGIHEWKFLRLHPGNFPTIRIAQLAALVHHSHGLLSRVLEMEELAELSSLFSSNCSEYWQQHYRFDKPSARRGGRMGIESVNLLMINLVVPFLFLYGSRTGEEKYMARGMHFLEQTSGEDNSIIRKWKDFGLEVNRASVSQALLELKNNYCNSKRCLSCGLGISLLKINAISG